jgi:hypothetical protein
MLTIEVNDEHFHQDILSDDVKRVHPDLPLNGTPEERREYQHRRDMDAYRTIKSSFPRFTPPSGIQLNNNGMPPKITRKDKSFLLSAETTA